MPKLWPRRSPPGARPVGETKPGRRQGRLPPPGQPRARRQWGAGPRTSARLRRPWTRRRRQTVSRRIRFAPNPPGPPDRRRRRATSRRRSLGWVSKCSVPPSGSRLARPLGYPGANRAGRRVSRVHEGKRSNPPPAGAKRGPSRPVRPARFGRSLSARTPAGLFDRWRLRIQFSWSRSSAVSRGRGASATTFPAARGNVSEAGRDSITTFRRHKRGGGFLPGAGQLHDKTWPGLI